MKRVTIALALGALMLVGCVTPSVQAQEDLSLNAAFGVRALAAVAESLIGGLLDAMQVVAATEDVRSGDWTRMQDLLLQFEISELTYDAWFLLPDGSYYKAKTGLAEANLADRAYFPRVMAGETTADDLVYSRSTDRKSLVLTTPVFDDAETVIGAVGVTLYLDDFSALLDDALRFPYGVGFYAYRTADGVVCVHVDSDLLLESNQSTGIALARGGLQISNVLGWTFVLGTVE